MDSPSPSAPETAAAVEPGSDRESNLHAEISREMVRLYKDHFGRGPTKAKTDFAGPDCVICTLENSFTRAERSLAEMGEHQQLRDIRLFFQYATESRFREVIERVTGRQVRAFVSGLDAGKDVCCEIFYLGPSTSENA